MYHYVRKQRAGLPFFTFLDQDNFVQQLRHVENQVGFVSGLHFAEFLSYPSETSMPKGAILTFDDGFLDHYEVVAPILEDMGTWGIFFIPTRIIDKTDLLDVHRVHILLGALGGERCLDLLREVTDNTPLQFEANEAFRTETYTDQKDSGDFALQFKRALNYFAGEGEQSILLDQITDIGMGSEERVSLERRFYMNPSMIRELHDAGNMVGSHSVNHHVMSKLPEDLQRFEVRQSLDDLERLLGGRPRVFCYPYGGFHSFTPATETILSDEGVTAAFNVENREITRRDFLNRPQALPRFDCAQLPHGRATTA